MWRSYLLVCKDQINIEQYVKLLDEMMDRYKGKVPYPKPIEANTLKRKQQVGIFLI